MSRWSDYSPERRAELNERRRAWHAAHRETRKVQAHENYVQNRDAYMARSRRYYGANRELIRQREREVTRFRQYGLTREMFDEYLDAQEEACAFCGRQLPKDISKIAIDHDHATGVYRGLVHTICNMAIGMAEAHFEGYMAASGA